MSYKTQNELLLDKLLTYYKDSENLETMLSIINGDSKISLRIVDWFATNYAKKNYTVYNNKENDRFKVYNDYKLKLRAYSKKRFDPFLLKEDYQYTLQPLTVSHYHLLQMRAHVVLSTLETLLAGLNCLLLHLPL